MPLVYVNFGIDLLCLNNFVKRPLNKKIECNFGIFLFIQISMYLVYKSKLYEDDPLHILGKDLNSHISKITPLNFPNLKQQHGLETNALFA